MTSSIPNGVWKIDTRATNHLCCDDLLIVIFWSNFLMGILFISHMLVQLLFRILLLFSNVLLVRSCTFNLLSISQLTLCTDYIVSFTSGKCILHDQTQEKELVLGSSVQGLYQLINL